MRIGLCLCAFLLAATAIPARASDTSSLFEKKCAGCHGDDGRGHTRMGRKFHAPDFDRAGYQQKTTNDEMRSAIANGITVDGQRRMPGWKGKLSPAEIEDLVRYVRAFPNAKK